jgi:hypothetical protein
MCTRTSIKARSVPGDAMPFLTSEMKVFWKNATDKQPGMTGDLLAGYF